jgi:hypothetical protein
MTNNDKANNGLPGGVRRSRRRLPVRAAIRFDDTLAANERHPLAQATPEGRAASRLRLIASILARMARTDLAR